MDMAEGLGDENGGPSSEDKKQIQLAFGFGKCKKRTRNPDAWKRVRQKKARISGKDYINVRGNYVPARAIGPDCNCKLMCYKQVDENMRKMIFQGFYDLKSYDEQNAYLFGLIRKQDIKRKTNPLSARRTCTYKYFLRFRGREINVCKVAFARIHSISAKKIRGLCEKLDQNILFPKDGRGKHSNRPQRIQPETRELIRRHMYTLLRNPQVREYFKEDKNQPNSSDLNITKMYKHFLLSHDTEALLPNSTAINPSYNPKVKMWLYRSVFNEEFHTKDFHILKRKVDMGYKQENESDYALHQKVFKRGKRKGMKPQKKQLSEHQTITLETIPADPPITLQTHQHQNGHQQVNASAVASTSSTMVGQIGVQTIMQRFPQIKTDSSNVAETSTTTTLPATAVIHLPVDVSFQGAATNGGVTGVIMDTSRNQMVHVQRQPSSSSVNSQQTLNVHKINYTIQDSQGGTAHITAAPQNYQIFQTTEGFHANVFGTSEHPIYHLDKGGGELISLRPIRIASDINMQIPTGY